MSAVEVDYDELVADWPPLSDEQRERIRARLLGEVTP